MCVRGARENCWVRELQSFALGAFHMLFSKVMCTGTVVVGYTHTHTHTGCRAPCDVDDESNLHHADCFQTALILQCAGPQITSSV